MKKLFLVFLFFFFSFLVFPLSCLAADVLINEFYTPTTSDDWVELYNSSDSSIDLSGWYLEDNTSNIASISEASISAKGFAVFGVGNRLNKDGDEVKLFDNSNNLQDSWSYTENPGDNICFGRNGDGGGWHRLSPCTKGGSNNSSNIVDPSPSPSPSPEPSEEPEDPSPSPSPSTAAVLSVSPNPVVKKKEVKEEIEREEFTGEVFGVEDEKEKEEEEKETEKEEGFKFTLPVFFILSGVGFIGIASFPFLKPKFVSLREKLRGRKGRKRRKIVVHNY